MINSNAFDYINVLDKAADAAALRNELISNNIQRRSRSHKESDLPRGRILREV